MRRRSIIHVADNSDYILYGVRLLSDRDFPVEQAAYYRKIGVGIQRGALSEDLMVWDNSKVRADAGTASTLLSKGTRTIRSGECVYVATESVNNLDFQFDGLTLEVVLRHISGVPRHRLSEGGRDALDGIADYMEITGARDRIITVPLGLLTNGVDYVGVSSVGPINRRQQLHRFASLKLHHERPHHPISGAVSFGILSPFTTQELPPTALQ